MIGRARRPSITRLELSTSVSSQQPADAEWLCFDAPQLVVSGSSAASRGRRSRAIGHERGRTAPRDNDGQSDGRGVGRRRRRPPRRTQCPMKRIRKRMPDVSASAYPDQPLRDFEPVIQSRIMHEGNAGYVDPERSNALRVSIEPLLP